VDRVDSLMMGHISLDETNGGFRLGGTVTYAGIAAHSLSYRVGIVTAAQADLPLSPLRREGIHVKVKQSPATTRFRNVYSPTGQRGQVIFSRADALRGDDVPPVWRDAPVVLVAPVAQEMESSILETFSSSALLGLTSQGWLRKWDADGTISPTDWPAAKTCLPRVSALFLSLEDVGGDWDLARHYARLAPLAVVTLAADGAVVFQREERQHFEPRPANAIDPTGAGDVFAAAFLVRLYETDDPAEACRFANVMASLSTEGEGWSHIPRRSAVEDWLSTQTGGDA